MASEPKKRLTATGQVRWDVWYRDPAGRQKTKTFDRKRDADAFRNSVEADKFRGTYLDPNAGRVTFREYAAIWAQSAPHEDTSAQNIESQFRLHVLPHLGDMRLCDVRATTIRHWVQSLSHLSAGSQHTIFGNVSAVFNAAVEDKRIVENPCRAKSVPKPKRSDPKVIPWTPEWVWQVRRQFPERYEIAVVLGAGLGLRQGEIFALSPDDVDWFANEVHVQRQVRVLNGSELRFALPKRNKARVVPMSPEVAALLSAHLSLFPAVDVTLPWSSRDARNGEPVTVPLVLTTGVGHALNKNYVNKIWAKACRAVGIPYGVGQHNGMHVLRHTYASNHLQEGENINAVSEWLGHEDPAFTLRVYTHLMKDKSTERSHTTVDAFLRAPQNAAESPGAAEAQ